MPRRLSVVAVLLVVSFADAAHAFGQSLPDSVRPGARVSITDDAGKVVGGIVDSVSPEMIRVKRRGGVDDVSRPTIVRIEKPDSLRNGALIGLTVGLGVGLIGTLAAGAGGGHHPEVIAWATFGNGIIYTALGTAIDGMVNSKRTLYERGRERQTRIAPLVGPGVGGATIRVSW